MIVKNNLASQNEITSRANVVYEFQCKLEDCASRISTYIGHTRCTLSRRLTLHLQDGAIKQHLRQQHKTEVSRDNLVSCTKIIASSKDHRRLQLLEAMHIREKAPAINIQSNMTSTIALFNSSLRQAGRNTQMSSSLSSSPLPTSHSST